MLKKEERVAHVKVDRENVEHEVLIGQDGGVRWVHITGDPLCCTEGF